jgi:hypothetical protein
LPPIPDISLRRSELPQWAMERTRLRGSALRAKAERVAPLE